MVVEYSTNELEKTRLVRLANVSLIAGAVCSCACFLLFLRPSMEADAVAKFMESSYWQHFFQWPVFTEFVLGGLAIFLVLLFCEQTPTGGRSFSSAPPNIKLILQVVIGAMVFIYGWLVVLGLFGILA
ncbi:MAG: hypothetical protein EG825_16955 [Rhodocyclaceae bacterium]|nr:hypothetical protein [Rhodocyclaceae bacterium]